MRRACPLAIVAALGAPAAAEPAAYAEAGGYELGIAAGGAVAPDVWSASAALGFGRFVADRLLLSAVVSGSRVAAGDDRALLLSALVEPGYHVPLGGPAHAFLGLGVGAGWLRGEGGGLVVAPRVGVKLVVGASVVLVAVGYEASTHDDELTRADEAAARSARVLAGWAVRW